MRDRRPSIEFRDFTMDSPSEVEALGLWSANPKEMLHLTPESIARHYLSTAAYVEERIAGYCAITVIYSRSVVELGGLVVNPEMRGLSIGKNLVKKVVGRVRDEFNPATILAFSNEKSSPLFQSLGGEVIENTDTLPPEVWKLCHICPNYTDVCSVGATCCNRVIDISAIGKET